MANVRQRFKNVILLASHEEKKTTFFNFTQIYFECNHNSSFISEITEPKTCNYKVIFKTPLVCHRNSMLVYPHLNETFQIEWDNIYTEFQNQVVTEKVKTLD